MSGYGYFWNSRGGDRKYNAESMSNWLKKFFTNGVFNGDLQVTASTGMTVSVGAGYACIDGKVIDYDSIQEFTLDAAYSSIRRVDTIVIEKNDVDRSFYCKLIKGTTSGQPEAPVRTDSIYQLVIAKIEIPAGATSITQSNITDTRPDSSLCGWVAGTVEEIDFTQITSQWQAYYEEFKASEMEDWQEWITSEEADFMAWYDHMKDILDESTAGHLQNEIEATWNMLTDPYDESESYAVYDRVTQDAKLYECIAPTTGPFDPSKWTKIKVEDQIKKRFVMSRVLSASNWVNSQYDLSNLYPNDEYDIDVAPCDLTTSDQLDAISKAQFVGSISSNSIIALGVVPTIDITVMVTAFQK